MVCCPAASTHYLNQYWVIIHDARWHSAEGITDCKVLVILHYRKRLCNICKAQWKHSNLTVWFAGNGFPGNVYATIPIIPRSQRLPQCDSVTTRSIFSRFKKHPTTRPSGWGMGCLLWVQMLVNFLLLSVQRNLWYIDILDQLDCILKALLSLLALLVMKYTV